MNDQMIIDHEPATMNPLMLIERAIEKGLDPGQLKQLVDLQEQWAASQAKSAYARAMTDCQQEMPLIVKDAQNSHTNSRFARLETVTHMAKPVYTRHGFALSFSEAESPKPTMKRIVCKVSHRDGHSESHWVELPIDGTGAKGGKSSMNEVQGCISTNSYGHRVLTCNVFNITIADTDLDGNRPSYDNPEPDDRAPKAPPRSQRNAPAAVSREQCANLFAYWQQKYPTEGKDDYSLWVRGAARRGFSVFNSQAWTPDDYHACCRALNFDPEAAQ